MGAPNKEFDLADELFKEDNGPKKARVHKITNGNLCLKKMRKSADTVSLMKTENQTSRLEKPRKRNRRKKETRGVTTPNPEKSALLQKYVEGFVEKLVKRSLNGEPNVRHSLKLRRVRAKKPVSTNGSSRPHQARRTFWTMNCSVTPKRMRHRTRTT